MEVMKYHEVQQQVELGVIIQQAEGTAGE